METNINNNNLRAMKTIRMAIGCFFLFSLVGNALAQHSNDPKYVIKRDNHYLEHVKNSSGVWVCQDATTFNPETCLWQSGPNVEHNYYFIDDEGRYKYLAAPLALNGVPYLSSHPGPDLNQTYFDYYFYDWDRGMARGIQEEVSMDDCDPNYHIPDDITQCWKVVWLTYDGGWKMSNYYSYNPNPLWITNPVPIRSVAVTSHDQSISNESGGITDLVIDDFSLEYNGSENIDIGTVGSYSYKLTPAYTLYDFDAVNNMYFAVPRELHYYYGGSDHPGSAPGSSSHTGTVQGYEWSLSGAGAGYLELTGGNTNSPTITCIQQNTSSSHIYATLTLTVTYEEAGSEPVTQTCTATITVLTQCQNPQQDLAPVITFEDVTVSWLPTASKYKVWWRKQGETAWNNFQEVLSGTSYPIEGLEYATNYEYTVTAYCGGAYLPIPDAGSGLIYSFRTKDAPNGLVYGAVFGGGRMADVGGKTEVVIINCEDISAVYGGNDIAGSVQGSDGSKITLGVNSGDEYATDYGTTNDGIGVKVGSVYGGGNGYYAYNGTSFVAATSDYKKQTVASGASVNAMTPLHQVGDPVWTNEGADTELDFPSIVKTAITVAANDHVKVDSLFGGAKNAFLTENTGNGCTIIIKGGTIFAVFGGNNFGGTQGYGKHHIEVQGTKANPTAVNGYGRDFGIGYLFGGGNKVYGSTTEIFITGGRCDTVFAGGNSASVYAANLTVNCAAGEPSNGAYGKIYSNAISGYDAEVGISINSDYDWNGTGVYNVRTLFGGNNQAAMNKVPNITLTSGSVGTVYGGGNAGDMTGWNDDGLIEFTGIDEIDNYTFNYSTYVLMSSPTMVVDYLYGGCQMSNVHYSTWVQLQDGHAGTVYGGCNISGDVGSTRKDLDQTPFINVDEPNPDYQEVYGATYVEASGGTVYKSLFAGSNGYYHCKDSYGIAYIEGIDYGDPEHNFIGMDVPTHNETHAVVSGDVVVKGNVYAGGNLACVGFEPIYISHSPYSYPSLVGLASLRMSGGTVDGNVFGGGNMASIYGSNEVRVWGGSIGQATGGALYGGNDRSGKTGQNSNRVLPDYYNTASDNYTSLKDPLVRTYVCVSGNPTVHTIYGGGNGYYKYCSSFEEAEAYHGPLETVVSCNLSDLPIQKDIFVDVALSGGDDGGYVDNVYGGGNGVSVEGFIKVFINTKDAESDTRNHIGTIFGGNNEGELSTTLPEIILLHGNVGTIYGGCNAGAMTGSHSHTIDGITYNNLGSMVYLRSTYPGPEGDIDVDAKVTGFVYGGCRSNGVTNNTLVFVEGGDHQTATLFGGSDISGDVDGTSQVIMTGGQVYKIYGGGNGNYDYSSTYLGLDAPSCANTLIDMTGGQVGTTTTDGAIFGGGWGHLTTVTGDVEINFGMNNNEASPYPMLIGDLYGGSALGTVNTNASNNTTIHIDNGTIQGNVYGGALGYKDEDDPTNDVAAKVYGKVHVYVGREEGGIYKGKATLIGSSIFGSNNVNGSPQDQVYVDVYQTAHTTTDEATYTANDRTYAIFQVFGGGNEADYHPESNGPDEDGDWSKKTHVNIHGCDNTIQRLFGGGNAADTDGVETVIDGGRFDFFFGGGNGVVAISNVLYGGASSRIKGGRFGWYFSGSNRLGSCYSIDFDDNATGECGDIVVDYLFNGGNQADQFGEMVLNLNCDDEVKNYLAVYGGCRLGKVYGNITINVHGGVFGSIYGGCQGADDYAAPVKKYPTLAEITAHPDDYPSGLSEFLANNTGLYGTGGNITINVYGGAIGDLFGGCDVNGNVEGKITINVESEGNTCGLFIGNVYGASNNTEYAPVDNTYSPTNSNAVPTPQVNILNGTIGGPYDCDGDGVTENYEGNVFGGGNRGKVTGNPKVIVGEKDSEGHIKPVTIKGSVYGGGNEGDVEGSPKVIIVPTE